MSKKFTQPFYEVIRFDRNVIATSTCSCLVPEFPEMTDEIDCPHDHPECLCKNDQTINCTVT